MKYAIAILGLLACVGARAEMCAGWPNRIAEDMRIAESDLTAEAAEQARAFLAEHGEAGDDDFAHGRANAHKRIEGHRLKQAAEQGGEQEVAAFCGWLTTEGFWSD